MKPLIGVTKISQQQLLDQESPKVPIPPTSLALASPAEQAQAPAQDPEPYPLGDFSLAEHRGGWRGESR